MREPKQAKNLKRFVESLAKEERPIEKAPPAFRFASTRDYRIAIVVAKEHAVIIDSLLDTDLYKFTMMQCVLHQFPAAQAEYKFKCRNPGTDLQAVIGPINEEIDHLCALHFRKDELDYLRSLRFMKSDFIDFLELFHLKRSCIQVKKAEGSDTDMRFAFEVLGCTPSCLRFRFLPSSTSATTASSILIRI